MLEGGKTDVCCGAKSDVIHHAMVLKGFLEEMLGDRRGKSSEL